MAGEPGYKRWTAILTAAVAVASLGLNVFLGISNQDLKNERLELEREKKKYENALRRHESTADLEARYLVASGMALLDRPIDDSSILENSVFENIQRWRTQWETGDKAVVVSRHGMQVSHGLVLLRVSNRGQQDARKIRLVARRHEFSLEGESGPPLSDLQSMEGEEVTLRLASLAPGEKIFVPIAHVLGTDSYFGQTYAPITLRWDNPVTQGEDSLRVQSMAPEDQWISKGLRLKVAQ